MQTAPSRHQTSVALALVALSFPLVLSACSGRAQATSPKAAINQAETLSTAFMAVADGVSPAVVSIKVEAKQKQRQGFFFGRPFNGPEGGRTGQGSGFIFRSDGAIVTNHHVVDGAERIEVVLQDDRTFDAKLVGSDPTTDLAVLKISAKGLPTVPFADSTQARVGQWVVAIGSPFGLDYSLTVGVVSAIGRGLGGNNKIEDYLQTDASINPGNSGGPLVNLKGQVLGINTMILGPRNAGIGFAIPSNLAKRVAEQLLETGAAKHAWIGVQFQELTPDLAESLGAGVKGGALIADVQPKSPAARAGLRSGDIITSVDGKRVNEGHDLLRLVISKRVGQKVNIGLIRGGKKMQLKLTTGTRPGSGQRNGDTQEDGADDSLGMKLAPMDPALARRMRYEGEGRVAVVQVAPSSPAARAGLKAGDVVIEADQKPVATPQDVKRALDDGRALLRVERGGGAYFVALKK